MAGTVPVVRWKVGKRSGLWMAWRDTAGGFWHGRGFWTWNQAYWYAVREAWFDATDRSIITTLLTL